MYVFGFSWAPSYLYLLWSAWCFPGTDVSRNPYTVDYSSNSYCSSLSVPPHSLRRFLLLPYWSYFRTFIVLQFSDFPLLQYRTFPSPRNFAQFFIVVVLHFHDFALLPFQTPPFSHFCTLVFFAVAHFHSLPLSQSHILAVSQCRTFVVPQFCSFVYSHFRCFAVCAFALSYPQDNNLPWPMVCSKG